MDKYLDYQPLYRQVVWVEREGIDIKSSTIAYWVGHTGALLTSLTDVIGSHVKSAQLIYPDYTNAPTFRRARGVRKQADTGLCTGRSSMG